MAKLWIRLRSWLARTHSSNFELHRHFFLQFFESEFIAAPGQGKVVVGGAVGILISLCLLYVPAYYHKYRMLDELASGEPYHLAVLADALFSIVGRRSGERNLHHSAVAGFVPRLCAITLR